MAGLLSWLGNTASKAYDQVNPFDNGLTWKQRHPTSQGSIGQQFANNGAVQRGQAAVAQVNPFDNGRTYDTVMNQGANYAPNPVSSVLHQVTHNGLTNLAGDVAKSVISPVNYFAKTDIINPLKETAAQITGNQQALANATRQSNIDLGLGQNGTNFSGGLRKFVGNTAQLGLNVAAPGMGGAITRDVENVVPKVVPALVTRTLANTATGAALGAPFSVASTVADPNTPLTAGNLVNSAVQGAALGAVTGGVGTVAVPALQKGAQLAGPAIRNAAMNTARVAQEANTRAFTPRVNLDEQNALRAMSDYLGGASQETGADLSRTIADARQVAQKYGLDINSGSRATRLESVNSLLDQIGQRSSQMSQGGYVRLPSSENVPEPLSNLLPDAEQRVFNQNPMLTKPMGLVDSAESQPRSSIQIPERQQELPLSRTPKPNAPSANSLPEYNTKKVGNLDKAFRSTRSIIERQGKSGQELAKDLQASRDTHELMLADLQKRIPTVRKLRGKAFADFVETTQGNMQAPNAKIAQAVKEWQSVHPEIRQRAVNAGLDVGDLGPNYYPHFIDYERIFKDKNTYNQAINHLVDTGQAKSPEEAIQLLSYARDVSRNRQFGNLEASRLVDLPFYDKTPNSLVSYLNGSAKRIAQTETFGAKDENALKLIRNIGLEGGDTEAAKNAYDIAVGAKQYNPTTIKISGNIRKYVTTTRLGLGALTNVAQNINTGIVTGHLRTLGSTLKQLSPKTRAFVGDTGVIADAVLNDLKTQSGYASFGQRAAGKVVDKVTAPLFGTVEKLNRSIAATAGRDYGLRLAQRGKEDVLRKLGVTGEIKNKTLTPEQQIQLARKVVEKTQFKVDPQDLPGWTDSPGGKLVSQFRTFSYAQGKFMSNEILKPIAKGNVLPLGRLLAALPLGYALYEAKRVIGGRPEEENKTKRGLQAFQNVGGAGLAFDLYQSLNPLGSKYLPSDRRVSMATGAVGGPALGVATQGVGALSDAIQRKNTPTDSSKLKGKLVAGKNANDYTDLTSLARFGLQQVPVVGTPIKNRLLPFTTESNASAGRTDNKGIDAINQASKDQQKKYKASFSPTDYALLSLNKSERAKAISQNLATQQKFDQLDKYAADKKVELGITAAKPGKNANDSEYKDALDRYNKDKSEGKISSVEDAKRSKELSKLKVGSVYSKDVRDLYGMSKTDAYNYLTTTEKGVDKGKMAKQLLAYDQALYNAGFESSLKYKYGIAPASKSGSGKGKGSKSTGVSTILDAIKASNAAIKPPTPPKSPDVTVKTNNLPSIYKRSPLKQYSVNKPRTARAKKLA